MPRDSSQQRQLIQISMNLHVEQHSVSLRSYDFFIYTSSSFDSVASLTFPLPPAPLPNIICWCLQRQINIGYMSCYGGGYINNEQGHKKCSIKHLSRDMREILPWHNKKSVMLHAMSEAPQFTALSETLVFLPLMQHQLWYCEQQLSKKSTVHPKSLKTNKQTKKRNKTKQNKTVI